MKFNKLIPELSVSNIENSKNFYLKLGFKIMYERKEDKFVFIEYEGNQIMLEEINDNWNTGILEYPFGRGINISMSVNNINEFYNDLKNKGFTFFKDIMLNKYKVDEIVYEDVEFLIQDPDGYLLRFNN